MRVLGEFYDLRFGECGFSREQAAAWLGLSTRTILRYDTAPHTWICPVYRAYRLRAGYLEELGREWEQWRIVRGRIYWPGDRYGLSPGEIMAISFERQRISELERRLRAAERPLMRAQVIPFPSTLEDEKE